MYDTTLLIVLISLSIIVSYFIGESAEEELEELPKKFSSIFGLWYILGEIIIFIAVARLIHPFIYVVSGAMIIANLFFAAAFSSRNSDLQRLIEYAVIFIVLTTTIYILI
ncbi:MAG: hypothetical protein RAK22_00095 [Nanoarchaeota archaeon]|nr:hypothetical protein [Nanoarchaeota archaeon]